MPSPPPPVSTQSVWIMTQKWGGGGYFLLFFFLWRNREKKTKSYTTCTFRLHKMMMVMVYWPIQQTEGAVAKWELYRTANDVPEGGGGGAGNNFFQKIYCIFPGKLKSRKIPTQVFSNRIPSCFFFARGCLPIVTWRGKSSFAPSTKNSWFSYRKNIKRGMSSVCLFFFFFYFN